MAEESREERSRKVRETSSSANTLTFKFSTPLPCVHLCPQHDPCFRRSRLHLRRSENLGFDQRSRSFPIRQPATRGEPPRGRTIRCPLYHSEGLVDCGWENRTHGLRTVSVVHPLRVESCAVCDICHPIYHPILVRQAIDDAPLGRQTYMVPDSHPRYQLEFSARHSQQSRNGQGCLYLRMALWALPLGLGRKF